MNTTATEAADALSAISTALNDVEILDGIGIGTFSRIVGELRGGRNNVTWGYEVDRGLPIKFVPASDAKNNPIVPSIVAETVSIDQADDQKVPFTALCVAIEFEHTYDENLPTPRWHLDLANKKRDGTWQPGPLTHIQFGGHGHQNRELDCFLKVPRWCHPPMEVGLLCEVVAANFFEEQWKELRETPSWNDAICRLQKLCFGRYFEKLQSSMNQSSYSALHSMWAQNWGA